jgi:hypothetical protein
MLINKNLLSTERIYNFGGERLLSVGIVFKAAQTIQMPRNNNNKNTINCPQNTTQKSKD